MFSTPELSIIYMAGQEGFEPPTLGFGVRRSAVRATGLYLKAYTVGFVATIFKDRRLPVLFCLFVNCMRFAKPAVLFEFKFFRFGAFVFGGGIILPFAFRAREVHIYFHRDTPYSIISLTTPAPTVRPPSLTANRSSFSMAIGVINSAVMVTLSPGITISTPSGKVNMPVTSVVRK